MKEIMGKWTPLDLSLCQDLVAEEGTYTPTQVLEYPACPNCTGMEETAEHAVFECLRFVVLRRCIFTTCGAPQGDKSPDNGFQKKCGNAEYSNAVSTTVTQIILGF